VVVGDLATQALVVADGATFEGHCAMRKENEVKVLPLLRQEGGGRKADEVLVER
jgi:cytoskeletal protein CcmA (bactofilin family)